MNLKNLLVFTQLIISCWSYHDTNDAVSKTVENEVDKFEYIRNEPGNELGIFTKVIAHVHRKANQTTEEWRLNREFLPIEVYESLTSRCLSDPEDSQFKWRGCVSDEEGLFAYVTWGVPEPKNKTITYLELEFKGFTKKNEKGEEQICILDEVYKSKAYVVLNTFSEVPSNDTFPRGIIESVTAVHHHQLEEFGQNFLSIFKDKIDVDLIYNFGKDEYYDRDPPYECFLSIASSESSSVIETKCDFFCPEVIKLPKGDMEKLLLQAKEVADKQEEDEDDDDNYDEDHTLTENIHEEL